MAVEILKRDNVTLFKPSSDSYKQVPNNTFNEIFNKTKKINCSGEFQFLSITGHREYQMEYKNGNLFSFGTMKIKQTATGIAKTTDCSEWWLITTIYYGDGTTEVIEQYLGTTCDDCGSSYPATCDDNGGGGGGGGENGGENCCVPAGFQLSSESISENLSDNCGLEGTDPSTGLPVKSCLHGWRFLRNTLAFYTWSYISREQSGLEKVDGIWKFKTVQHSGMDIEGTIPLCVSFSCNIGSAIPSISTSRQQARMDITFTTTLNVTCCPWCSPTNTTDSKYTTWNSQ